MIALYVIPAGGASKSTSIGLSNSAKVILLPSMVFNDHQSNLFSTKNKDK